MSLLWLLSLGIAVAQENTKPVTLASGDMVRILAITDRSTEKTWSADGTPVTFAFPDLVKSTLGSYKGKPNPVNIITIVFELNRKREGDMPSIAYRVPAWKHDFDSLYIYLEDKAAPSYAERLTFAFEHPFGFTEASDVSVGVAQGEWSTVGAYGFKNGKVVGHRGQSFGAVVKAGSPGQVGIFVALPTGVASSGYQVVALDAHGTELRPTGTAGSNGLSLPDKFWFDGAVKDVAKVELQVRPLEWITFKGVRLKPIG